MESCVYFTTTNGFVVIIVLNVDDFIAFSNNSNLNNLCKRNVMSIFKMKYLGEFENVKK